MRVLFSLFLSLIFLLILLVSFTVLARQTVMLVPVGHRADELSRATDHVIHALEKRLKKHHSVLTREALQQIKKSNDTALISAELTEAMSLVDRALEKHNRFEASSQDTLLALASVEHHLNHHIEPSHQSTLLMKSVLLAQAWLSYQQGSKDQARDAIHKLQLGSPIDDQDLTFYSPRFRRFFSQVRSEAVTEKRKGSVFFETKPSSASVFWGHRYVGETPVTQSLPLGTQVVTISSPGRVSVVKTIHVEEGNEIKLKAKLKWKSKAAKTENDLKTINWPKLTPAQRLSYVALLAHAAQSDHALLLHFGGTSKSPKPQLTLYHKKYSQFLKTVSFPEAWSPRDPQAAEKVALYFADKLLPYLSADSDALWKAELDDSFVIDHRMARPAAGKFYKKPWFWMVAGGVLAASTAVLATSGSSSPGQERVSLVWEGVSP